MRRRNLLQQFDEPIDVKINKSVELVERDVLESILFHRIENVAKEMYCETWQWMGKHRGILGFDCNSDRMINSAWLESDDALVECPKEGISFHQSREVCFGTAFDFLAKVDHCRIGNHSPLYDLRTCCGRIGEGSIEHGLEDGIITFEDNTKIQQNSLFLRQTDGGKLVVHLYAR